MSANRITHSAAEDKLRTQIRSRVCENLSKWNYSLEIDRMASFYCIGSHGQMVTISAFQNIKMLAEDPSSILGGSTGTWENPGPHFFFAGFLRFELSSFDDADDRRDEQDLLF